MLSSLIAPFRRLYGDPSIRDDQEEDEAPEQDEIEIPQVNTGITKKSRPDHFNQLQGPQPTHSEANGTPKPDETEVFEGAGIITALDPGMQKGVINRQYQFETERFCNGDQDFRRGSKVEFRAERTRTRPQWKVTHMTLEETAVQKINKELCRYKKVVGTVKSIGYDCVNVQVGKEKENKAARMIRVPNTPELSVSFEWMPGDMMQLHLENLLPDNECNDDIPADTTMCKVISIAPTSTKTVVGKVTKRSHNFLIDDQIYFTQEMCNFQFRMDATVKCTAIESMQYIGEETVSWRAINVEKSKFMFYNDEMALASSGGVEGDDGYLDEVGRLVVDEYKTLLNDKFGIRVTPKFLSFPPQTIGNVSKKTLTVENSSANSIRLKQINFNQDTSVCQFTIQPRGHDMEQRDTELPLFPGDDIIFDVTCCPKMIGRTKEICVFDFGEFTIGSIFSVTGQSVEEQLLMAKNSTDDRPRFKKQIGNNDIGRITTDLNRRRIRGCQTVRAPFFSQRRIPLNKIPTELFKITKEQDEKELKRRYPNCLDPLIFENYKEKFQVSLWFEEIENDLRRRQYDLHQVRLMRNNGSPVTFQFMAPGIQEYQPPVNLQDTIDAFDEESPTNAKFQGTITKVVDNEVTCVFGDAFNRQYTGIPMTIQFNLSRTNYKRCHYSVQTAVDYLGREFLFPENNIEVKPARILVYENDKEKSIDAEIEAANHQNGEASMKAPSQSIFNKAKPAMFTENRSTTESSNNDVIGRRVQSIRSRFVSDTPSAPSCTTAKLEWFNKNLNEEQKNAVRRILRGQARPLPYIIYGPPGTGKTVTLVEAVMQVNKLDKNSRVLVCAPSNAAADVIAEYLATSYEYLPGDFVRLNGYLRSGQSMMETIAPFCTDGEDLSNIAMHRLIVATCMTAGQFFSLDLSVGHFTHVFIDEAGYCTEPETMVPTILLALSKGGQLILAGDPNQLGPVLMSDVAQNCGLNRSLLERLMLRQLYSRDVEHFPEEKYNPLVLTKLVKNYRAHPTLLKLPSKLFYDDDLVSRASQAEAYDLCQDPNMRDVLKSQGVPLVFHGVQGLCTRDKDSPSWYNKAEIIQVVQYVTLLLGKCGLTYEDIGIITPYRKQVEKIRLALQLMLGIGTDELPKVASVEEFQGGERKVIIISTVRSVNEDRVKMTSEFLERLTFLYQPKRFNVVVTRAKALMIVVGNPHVLEKNTYWLQLLKYSIELNAYKGCNLPIHLNDFLRVQVQERALKEKAEMDKISRENGASTPDDDDGNHFDN